MGVGGVGAADEGAWVRRKRLGVIVGAEDVEEADAMRRGARTPGVVGDPWVESGSDSEEGRECKECKGEVGADSKASKNEEEGV